MSDMKIFLRILHIIFQNFYTSKFQNFWEFLYNFINFYKISDFLYKLERIGKHFSEEIEKVYIFSFRIFHKYEI